MAVRIGGRGDDKLVGTSRNDLILSGRGDDKVDAGAGNDVVFAGSGDDVVDAGSGNDFVSAGSGNDTVDGGEGDDTIFGGRGNDTLKGGEGDDYLNGGRGFDTAVYEGSIEDYAIQTSGGRSLRTTVTDLNTANGDEGTDRLRKVEALQFDDYLAFLDGRNNAVLARDDDAGSFENVLSVTIDPATLLANDFDFDGDSLSITSVGNAQNGTVALVAGQIVFTPTAGFSGTTRFEYTVSDGRGSTDIARVILEIESTPVGPVTDVDPTTNEIAEDAGVGTLVGLTGLATDPDTIDTVSYAIDDTRFTINALGVVRVAAGASFDHETESAITVEVTATSSDTSTSSETFDIAVTDVNEDPIGPVTDIDPALNEIAEDAGAGTIVGLTGLATDPDGTATVTYSIDDTRFTIDAAGVVRVAAGVSFDHESEPTITVELAATSSDTSTSSETFIIDVTDVNEAGVGPVSDDDAAANELAEGAGTGSVVGITGLATDPDGTDTVSYSIDDTRFTIDALGVVRVAAGASFDHETEPTITVEITATSSDTSTSSETFVIDITDVNEAGVGPVTDDDAAANEIAEDAGSGTVVGITGLATDPDGTDTVSYSIDDIRFTIDAAGVVRVAAGASFDHETEPTITVEITATSSDTSTSSETFVVDVTDVNEAPVGPVTDEDAAANEIAEDAGAGAGAVVGLTGLATDPDGTDTVSYSIDDTRFTIDVTGVVRVAAGASFDHETESSITVEITATSSDTSTSSETFVIDVTDVNEAGVGPVTDDDVAANEIAEDAGSDTVVGITGLATDPDGTDTVSYSIDDTRFTIDAAGVVRVAAGASFDHETEPTVTVEITATSSDTSTSSETFVIDVTDVNEAPVGPVTDDDAAANEIAEDAGSGALVGITGLATDPDGTDTVSYSIDDMRFTIDAAGVVRVAAGASFDHETEPTITVEITATSSDTSTSSETFVIDVTDVNEAPVGPVTDDDTAANEIAEDAGTSAVVGITGLATDPDGTDTVSYSIDDTRFTIDAAGVVRVAAGASFDHETEPSITVEITATSSDTSSSSETFVIDVTDVNEAPVGPVTDNDPASNEIAEDAGAGTIVGLTGLATDSDGTDTVSYSIDDTRFTIDAAGVVRVAAGASFDFETEPAVTVEVTATSSDASTSSETFLIAITDVDDTAEMPTLTVSDASGDEDTVFPLSVSAALTDTDGSEILTVEVSNIPVGAILSDGTNSFTALVGNTTADVSAFNLALLTITPPPNSEDDFQLAVTVTATETNGGDTSVNTDTIDVTVEGVSDSVLFFTATSSSFGRELYRVTQSGSVIRVTDINVGPGDSSPSQLTEFDGELYFTAIGSVGRELYKVTSTGSVALAADINVGSGDSFPSQLTEFDGELYFVATGSVGRELYKVTSTGSVVLVADIDLGAGSSSPTEFTSFNGELYFVASSPSFGRELFKLTSTGSVVLAADINVGPGRSAAFSFTEFNNELYFTAFSPSFGTELYKVTSTGSVVLTADINMGPGSSGPFGFTEFNGEFYFTATGSVGRELYKVTSTGSVVLAADINMGAGNSSPVGYTEFNGELYFSAASATFGDELYKVTSTGSVVLAADINVGSGNGRPSDFTEFGGELYFRASSSSFGSELYKLTSTGSVVLTEDINLGSASSSPLRFTEFGGELYFTATSSSYGQELYKVMSAGSVVLAADINIGPGDSFPFGFIEFNGELYFRATSSSFGSELYKATSAGSVVRVDDINSGSPNSSPGDFLVFQDDIASPPSLRVADAIGDEDTAIALSVSGGLADTDGSETLTTEVSGIPVGATLSDGMNSFTATVGDTTANVTKWNLNALTITPPTDSFDDFILTITMTSTEANSGGTNAVSDIINVTVNPVPDITLFFAATTASDGQELYKVTLSGSVVQVADINMGAGGSDPAEFAEFNGELYFRATSPSFGSELYKLTSAGSVVLAADIDTGTDSSSPGDFTAFNDELYFAAIGSVGRELYKVTSTGSMVLAADIDLGAGSSSPTEFTSFNGELYFVASSPSFERELFKITSTGSVVVAADINSGTDSSSPAEFTVFNGELYFRAISSSFGSELYKVTSTGSVVLAADINPGILGSSPKQLTEFNGELYFQASTPSFGSELYKLTAAGSLILAADIRTGSDSSDPAEFTVFNGELYFSAVTPSFGQELYKVTSTGSVVLAADIQTGAVDSSPTEFTEFNGELYFSARSATFGNELHKVTSTGSVVLVADINTGTGHSDLGEFTEFNGELYFRANSSSFGSELYKVTSTGSVVLVEDIDVGASNSIPSGFFVFKDDVASLPGLRVTPATGDEDTAIALNVSGGLADTDGSETLSIEISTIPVGATLSDGSNSFTATAGMTSVVITTWALALLTITPPANANDDFQLTVTATATETSNGDTSQSLGTIDVTVTDVQDPVGPVTDDDPASNEIAEDAGAGSIVGLTGLASDPDGTDTVSYSIDDTRFTIDAAGVVRVAAGASFDFETETAITVEVTATSSDASTSSETFLIAVTDVDDTAEMPTLTVSDASGDEDTAIALDVTAALTDTDGSETLTVEVSNIPVGATLSDGTNSFTATTGSTTADVSAWTLALLTITPPGNSEDDFQLAVTVTATETNGGDTSVNTDTIDVTVEGVSDSVLFFTATSSSFGRELYRVTQSGSVIQVADIDAGPGSSFPSSFINFNGELYFGAASPSFGRELYKVTFTGSVVLAADIQTGAVDSFPADFTEFNGELYFTATSSSFGRELYRVTQSGSVIRVTDINVGPGDSSPSQLTEFDGELYFTAIGSVGRELYKVTSTGSVALAADINVGSGDSFPSQLTEFDGELYFVATGSVGRELYKVTSTGSVVLVADIDLGAGSSSPTEFTSFNGELYFVASSPSFGRELFKLTSTGSVVLAADINVGPGRSAAFSFTEFNNELYFTAFSPSFGTELYKVTSTGSVVLTADINMGPGSSGPFGFTEFNGEFYFTATGSVGRELYKVTSTGSVVLAADINMGAGNSSPVGYTEFNGELYFSAASATFGDELYKVTSTGSVVLAADINVGSGNGRPSDFTEFGGELYFRASSSSFGSELYKLTSTGSVVLTEDINLGAPGSDPANFFVFADESGGIV